MYFSLIPVQLINSTGIQELFLVLITVFVLFPGAYNRGAVVVVVGGIYLRDLYPGAYIWGWLISGGGLFLGAYIQELISGGLYPGGLYRGTYIQWLISRVLLSRGLYSTLTIFKDLTCFTRTEWARTFAANK